MLQAGSDFAAQQYRRDAHPNAAERSAIQFERHAHVINGGRVIDQAQLPAEAGVLDELKVGTVGHRFADEIGIGVQNGVAVGIDDGRVQNDRPIAHHRFDHGVEIAVRAQVVLDGAAHRLGITGIHLGAAQVGGGSGRQVFQLRGQLGGGFMRGRNLLADQLGDVNVGKRRHQGGYHQGDGQHELSSSAHTLSAASYPTAELAPG